MKTRRHHKKHTNTTKGTYLHFLNTIPVNFLDIVGTRDDNTRHQVTDPMKDITQLLVRQC